MQQTPGLGLVEHRHDTRHQVQTRRHTFEALTLIGMLEILENVVLRMCQLDQGLVDRRALVLPHLALGQQLRYRYLCIVFGMRPGLAGGQSGQRRFDQQQLAGERHQAVLVERHAR